MDADRSGTTAMCLPCAATDTTVPEPVAIARKPVRVTRLSRSLLEAVPFWLYFQVLTARTFPEPTRPEICGPPNPQSVSR